MAKKSTTQRLARMWRNNKYAFFLTVILSAGILVNVVLLAVIVWPTFQEIDRLEIEQERLQERYAAIMQVPLPEQASEADMDELYRQVPRLLEQSRFMISLKEIERQSGISINTLTSGSGARGVSEVSSANNASTSGTGRAAFIAENMSLRVSGTFSQASRFSGINEFIERLQQLERITQINSLTYNANNTLRNSGLDQVTGVRESYEIDLNLSIFSVER